MLGLSFIFCIFAVIIALFKRGRYLKQIIVLSVLTFIVFEFTILATNRQDPQNPFGSIGLAIIGSTIASLLSLIAFVLSFYKKSSSKP